MQKPESEVGLDPHPKQEVALYSDATEILYGGAAGGGKSFLVRIFLIFHCVAIKNLQCYLFRLHFDDLKKNHVEGDSGFRALLAPWIAAGLVEVLEGEIRFWNGSRIYLCFCSLDKHLDKYLGAEMHILAIEEASQFKMAHIQFLRSRVRMSEVMKDTLPDDMRHKLPRILYTTNPGGPAHGYFKREFVKAREYYAIERAEDSEGGFLRQFIPALLTDNPSLNAEEYARTLSGLGSPELVKAMLDGNWDAMVGSYFPEYSDSIHSTFNFVPPSHWWKYRTFDWGGSEPFVVLWWCVSDGEEFEDHEGDKLWYPRGALICYREWNGCDPDDPAKGLKMRNEDIARGILDRTAKGEKVAMTLTDSLPFQERGAVSIAETFEKEGVILTRADTSRVPGWQTLRSRLVGEDGMPMIYFQAQCKYVREYIPMLGYHKTNPEDAADSGEATHASDCVRYACMARPIQTKKLPEPITPFVRKNPTFDSVVKHLQRQKNKRVW